MKKRLLILSTLFVSIIGYSQTTFTASNFITYEVINAQPPYTVQVKDYNFISGGAIVNIPTSVSYNSITYSVTVIGDNAFTGNATTGEQITSVVIPSTVTFIGYNAFSYNLLSSITIPDSVTQIGALSFINNQLTSVTLSNNLISIPTGAFQGNDLISISIPNSVTSIQGNAFFNNQLTSITIPSSVILLGQRAFANNPLTSVTCLGTNPATVFTNNVVNLTIDSISYNRSNINLFIPNGTSSAYAAAGWTGFNSVTTLNTSNFELANDIKVISATEEIRIANSSNIQLQNYTIYSISGAEVASGTESKIKTSTIANGIYILKLNFDKGIVAKKVVIN